MKSGQTSAEKITHQETLQLISQHYMSHRWDVIVAPKGSLVDIIAAKDGKMHFVKAIGDKDAAYLDGIAKNTYIQNSFSNVATPVYAMAASAGDAITYKFINPNTNSRVRITESKLARSAPANPPAGKQAGGSEHSLQPRRAGTVISLRKK